MKFETKVTRTVTVELTQEEVNDLKNAWGRLDNLLSAGFDIPPHQVDAIHTAQKVLGGLV